MTSRPQFDQADVTGETRQYVGTVGTTAIDLPPAPIAGRFVAEVMFNTQELGAQNQRLLYSYDGGVTFQSLKRNTILGWFVRGQQTGIKIKANTGTVNYDVTVNFEEL